MAKTIKFNLKLDNSYVRDIKGLQENFCVNDILEVYNNGLLQKWLKVRGYNDYLKKVESIDKNKSVIVQLVRIFDIAKDENEIKEAIYSLEFEENRKKYLEKFAKIENSLQKIISDYHKGYDELKDNIFLNKKNMPFLKTASREISNRYLKLFEVDYETLYWMLKEKSPLMVYAILMNEKLRDLWLKDRAIKRDLRYFIDIDYESKNTFFERLDLEVMIQKAGDVEKINGYYPIANREPVLVISVDREEKNLLYPCGVSWSYNDTLEYINLKDIFESMQLVCFRKKTDGYWKDLETKGTKVMILSIPNGTFIATPDNPKEEYGAEEVNGNFLILDGLLYKSNTSNKSIIYIKV